MLLVASIITYIILKKQQNQLVEAKRQLLYTTNEISNRDTTFTDHFCPLTNLNEQQLSNNTVTDNLTTNNPSNSNLNILKKFQRTSALKKFYNLLFPLLTEIIFLLLLFICACLWPTILSIPYLLAFLGLITKWSFSSQLKGSKVQFFLKIFFIFYSSLHILTIYLYQINLFQELIEPQSFPARLVGLIQIVFTRCEQPAHFYLNSNLKWQQIAYPFAILGLYWFISLELSYGTEKVKDKKEEIERLRTNRVSLQAEVGESDLEETEKQVNFRKS